MSVILNFPEYRVQAQHLAEALSIPCESIEVHHFPDKESRITIPGIFPDHAIIYCGLEYPNDKLVELMLTVKTLNQHNCNRVSLVTPYLCYMRQDMAFHKGEAISQDIIGRYLAELFDDIITIDAHLHRTTSLQQVFPDTNTVHISAASSFTQLLQQNTADVVLLGPDEESEQWVKTIATENNLAYAVARKVRHSDKDVSIMLPEFDFENKPVVLVDDVISSGGTMVNIAKQLQQKNIRQLDVLVTHALFNKNTQDKLKQAGINHIWSSDSIPHPSNKVSIIPLVAEHVKNWIS